MPKVKSKPATSITFGEAMLRREQEVADLLALCPNRISQLFALVQDAYRQAIVVCERTRPGDTPLTAAEFAYAITRLWAVMKRVSSFAFADWAAWPTAQIPVSFCDRSGASALFVMRDFAWAVLHESCASGGYGFSGDWHPYSDLPIDDQVIADFRDKAGAGIWSRILPPADQFPVRAFNAEQSRLAAQLYIEQQAVNANPPLSADGELVATLAEDAREKVNRVVNGRDGPTVIRDLVLVAADAVELIAEATEPEAIVESTGPIITLLEVSDAIGSRASGVPETGGIADAVEDIHRFAALTHEEMNRSRFWPSRDTLALTADVRGKAQALLRSCKGIVSEYDPDAWREAARDAAAGSSGELASDAEEGLPRPTIDEHRNVRYGGKVMNVGAGLPGDIAEELFRSRNLRVPVDDAMSELGLADRRRWNKQLDKLRSRLKAGGMKELADRIKTDRRTNTLYVQQL